jgi:hypothetical protein
MNQKLSRKNFLRLSAMTGAAFAARPLFAQGSSAPRAAPSDIVNVALIGCGAQGPGVARSFMGLGDVRIVAAVNFTDLKEPVPENIVDTYTEQK